MQECYSYNAHAFFCSYVETAADLGKHLNNVPEKQASCIAVKI